MSDRFERTEILFGEEAVKKLSNAKVAVFGIGGVGGYVCEALVRSGVGYFDLFDSDTVCLSNLNRQIIALQSTVGKYKAEVMKERMLEINPKVSVNCHNVFYTSENANDFDLSVYDYVVDAVDSVIAKIELAKRCNDLNIKIISSMGAGNKVNPTDFKVADIYKTSVCPLARVMRRELKKAGVKKLKVVYSQEEIVKPLYSDIIKEKLPKGEKLPVGSCSFVPSVCGLIIASEVVKDLTK